MRVSALQDPGHSTGEPTFRRAKVENIAVVLEHVDLLDALDGLDACGSQRAATTPSAGAGDQGAEVRGARCEVQGYEDQHRDGRQTALSACRSSKH